MRSLRAAGGAGSGRRLELGFDSLEANPQLLVLLAGGNDHVSQDLDFLATGDVHVAEKALDLPLDDSLDFPAHAVGRPGGVGHEPGNIVQEAVARLGHACIFSRIEPRSNNVGCAAGKRNGVDEPERPGPSPGRPGHLMPPLLALPFPAIDPVAVAIGPFAVRWYALAYIAGLIGGWLYARRLVLNEGLWAGLKRPTTNDLDDLIVWVALGVVLGGRIGYVLFYNFDAYFDDPLEMLAIWRGGMSFHGGFLGAIMAILLFARSRGLNGLAMLDLAAVVTPIGLFFGRVANFINGELWGRPAPDFPYAFVFPEAGPVPRHASQLYEAFGEGLVLFLVMAMAMRRFGFRRPGLLGGLFVFGYALARIICEFFREPDPQLGFLFGSSIEALGGGITMGMLLSIPMALVGAIAIWLAARGFTRPPPLASAASA